MDSKVSSVMSTDATKIHKNGKLYFILLFHLCEISWVLVRVQTSAWTLTLLWAPHSVRELGNISWENTSNGAQKTRNSYSHDIKAQAETESWGMPF